MITSVRVTSRYFCGVSPASIKTMLASGELVALLADYTLEEMGLHAVYASRRQQSTLLRSFVDFLVERFASPAFAAYC